MGKASVSKRVGYLACKYIYVTMNYNVKSRM